MCGLIAAVNVSISSSDLDLIRHRGPDDSGMERFSIGNHAVALGHRRLSIVDLSPTGRQPMHSAGGGGSIVYNGEIYNHAALRSQMGDVVFQGSSDTESAINWLETHGIAGCYDFNGIFAFAYVDRRARCLYLARDPFGVKPLYYSVLGSKVVAASELAPLLRLLNPEVDAESIALALRLRYLPSPFTLYRKIRKVRPGHYVRVDLSGSQLSVSEQPYAVGPWSGMSDLSYAEATDVYAAHVDRAVGAQMMSDVEVGILLSGGVDSALISHYASKHVGRPLKVFSVGFDSAHRENELEEARATAAVLGMDFHSRTIAEHEFVDALQQIASVVEEPLATTSVIPMHFLSELAANHVKVVLSGQGADESMGGYRRYLGYGLASSFPPSLAPIARRLTSSRAMNDDYVGRGLNTLSARSETERLLAAYEVFSAEEIFELTGHRESRSREVIEYAYETWRCSELPSPAARMMRLDLRMGLPDDLLLYTDRITMRHSLECRVPFLDLELVRFAESLPLHYKLTPFSAKKIHKDAASRVLPTEIVRRKKKGFLSPTNEWFRNPTRLRGLLSDHGSQLAQYVDISTVNKVIEKHAAGINQERQLFLILMLAFVLNR